MSNAPALLLILVASDRLACVRVPITSFEDPTTAHVIRAEMMDASLKRAIYACIDTYPFLTACAIPRLR